MLVGCSVVPLGKNDFEHLRTGPLSIVRWAKVALLQQKLVFPLEPFSHQYYKKLM